MGFWNRLPSESEADQAEMLESYTRWVRGEKLSGKQQRFLRFFQERDSSQLLKELVDLAYQFYKGEELASTISLLESNSHKLSSEVQTRMKDNLLRSIRKDKKQSTTNVGYIPQAAYSPDQLGSASELAYDDEAHVLTEDSMSSLAILDNEVLPLDSEISVPVSLSDWQLTLEVDVEGEVSKEFNLDIKHMTFGSDKQNTIPLLRNATASSVHCQLTIEKDQVYLTDLDSESGTQINGTSIHEPTPISVGTIVSVGTQSFEVIEIERETGTLMISFEEIEGQLAGQIFTVQARHIIIGRSGKLAHIHVPDPNRTLSRQHAQFELLRSNQIYVTDLDSTNGTYVDEIKIAAPTPVVVGSSLRFGDVCCRVTAIEPI